MSEQPDNNGGMANVMTRNIRTLIERCRREQRDERPEVRIADTITRFTGSMAFVYIHAVLFGGWIIGNLPWVP